MTAPYPSTTPERTRWVVQRRGSRNPVRAGRPYAFFRERERTNNGIKDVAAVFLTNRECPWKCVMCDLWENTTEKPLPTGKITEQVQFALSQLGPAPVLKLYNSGSFFDAGAIPRAEWPAIASLCRGFERLVVECHPRLIGKPVLDFARMLPCSLQIAMGLETAHPEALQALNKGITPAEFRAAAGFLSENGIGIRTFLLVHPPFIPNQESMPWLERSLLFAFDSGSEVISAIPLRAGRAGLAELRDRGVAREPSLHEIEQAQELGIRLKRGLALTDTWDLSRFAACPSCFRARIARIERINFRQELEPAVFCEFCGGG